MKRILALLLSLLLVTTAAAKTVDITGNESFLLWNRCNNNECEESFLLFGYNSCTDSVEMYSVVKAYAESKGVTMYAVDGSLLGIREALGGGSLELPAIVVYNKSTRALGGGDGIKSLSALKAIADPILDARNPKIQLTIGSDIMLCDGKKIKLEVPATIINGRTMVPLRAVFDALGVAVTWNGQSKHITAKKGGIELGLTVGNNLMSVNYDYVKLDSPPVILNGKTMVPARAISEPFGADVSWDPTTRTVTIQ
ncbi:MAG: copper amine oxidase N-terminal domain-containing protein [Oscillospiraceae bacterium]|nr:copper amine oxidase N-terminal domain-containing protein [Oscillospiraceae bacterium]